MKNRPSLLFIAQFDSLSDAAVADQCAALKTGAPSNIPLLWALSGETITTLQLDDANLALLNERVTSGGDALLWSGPNELPLRLSSSPEAYELDGARPVGQSGARWVGTFRGATPVELAGKAGTANAISLAALLPRVRASGSARDRVLAAARSALLRVKKRYAGIDPMYIVCELWHPELRAELRALLTESALAKRLSSTLSEGEHRVVVPEEEGSSPLVRARHNELNQMGGQLHGGNDSEREYVANMNGETRLAADGFDTLFSAGNLRGFAASDGTETGRYGERPGRMTLYRTQQRRAVIDAEPLGAFSFEEGEHRRGLSGVFRFSSVPFVAAGIVRSDWSTWYGHGWLLCEADVRYPSVAIEPQHPAQESWSADLDPLRLALLHGEPGTAFAIEAASEAGQLHSVPADTPIVGSFFRISAGDSAVSVIALGPAATVPIEIVVEIKRRRRGDCCVLLPFGRHRRLAAERWSGVPDRVVLAMTPRLLAIEDLEVSTTLLRGLG